MKRTILVVDDDEPVRMAIRDALSTKYKVLEASTYSEAVKLCKNRIHLAVIDYVLPDNDGFELLKSLRRKMPLLPVIMITGFSSEDVAIEALKAGVTDYMRKPLTLKYLLARTSEILGEKHENGHTEVLKSRKEFLVDSIAMYLEKRYKESDLTLDRISSMVNMDRYSFCKAFKARFGQTFISYLNNIRIRKAIGLFKNDLNMAEIALLVGFNNVEYFDRVFKKIHGVRPRDYRKKMKRNETQ